MPRSVVINNPSLNKLVSSMLEQLKNEGYSSTTINNYYNRLRPIQKYMRNNGIDDYTPDIGIKYYEEYLKNNHPGIIQKREIHCTILRLNDYCSGDGYIAKHTIGNLATIPASYSEDVQRFFFSPEIISVEKSTISRRTRALTRFLTNCIRCGVLSVKELSPQVVLLSSKDVPDIDDWTTTRQFLHFLAEEGSTANDLSTFVPKGRRDIHVPSTYSIDDLQMLEASVDRNTYQGKRDIVVLLMADRLAIRAGDIAAMKVSNLDFENQTIRFIQEKTANEIILPMIPELKDALKDFLTQEETDTKDGYLFHTLRAPHHPLHGHIISCIVRKYFDRAGIDTTGKKCGPHSLRASVSTSMVNDDIPYEVVRNILGHTSPDSIRHYAKNDIEKLRRCAIPVPIPTGKFMDFLKEGVRN